jgi:hypothetical protein
MRCRANATSLGQLRLKTLQLGNVRRAASGDDISIHFLDRGAEAFAFTFG